MVATYRRWRRFGEEREGEREGGEEEVRWERYIAKIG